jgi:preprotein translocase subunit SecG
MGIYIFISVLVIIACILQIMIVLVQNSKGGGLAANFTSAGQTMGVRKTADFLEKSTWTRSQKCCLTLKLNKMAQLKGKILAGKVLVKPNEAEEKLQVELLFRIQQRKNLVREKLFLLEQPKKMKRWK